MTRRFFKSILVAIEDPQQRRQLPLRRAAELARRTGGRLTLFHSAFNPLAVGPGPQGITRDSHEAQTIAARRSTLQKLAAPLRRQGLKVVIKVAWDYPPFEAIVREALRVRPELVVAGTRRHIAGARFFLTNNDWQLIRLCPVPLLFVKQERAYGKARVLAAIDPLHEASRRAPLDRRILENAQAMASIHDGRLDVVHAYQSLYSFAPPIYSEAYIASIDPRIEQQHRRRAQLALERATAAFGIGAGQLHLESGRATDVLPAVARRRRIDVLVMGAVSRRGLDRLFIGSTAEHVLDRLHCDVLVIKPRGFRTSVPRRYSPVQLDMPAF